jgi:hypothetical protein
MADSNPTTNAELAVRLTDYADAVDNPAHHDMETDLRTAARMLLGIERLALAPLPALRAALENAAVNTTDATTARLLREIIG